MLRRNPEAEGTGRLPMLESAILFLVVLFALPAILDHDGSFREVDDERGR